MTKHIVFFSNYHISIVFTAYKNYTHNQPSPKSFSKVKDLLGVQGRNIKAIKSQTGVLKVGVLDRNDPANVEIAGKTQKDGDW